MQALEAYADAIPDDPDDPRTRQQKMADCLLDLVLRPGETDAPAGSADADRGRVGRHARRRRRAGRDRRSRRARRDGPRPGPPASPDVADRRTRGRSADRTGVCPPTTCRRRRRCRTRALGRRTRRLRTAGGPDLDGGCSRANWRPGRESAAPPCSTLKRHRRRRSGRRTRTAQRTDRRRRGRARRTRALVPEMLRRAPHGRTEPPADRRHPTLTGDATADARRRRLVGGRPIVPSTTAGASAAPRRSGDGACPTAWCAPRRLPTPPTRPAGRRGLAGE